MAGWVAHVVVLVLSDADPASDQLDDRAPPAGQALHLVLISPLGMLLLGAIAALILAVFRVTARLEA